MTGPRGRRARDAPPGPICAPEEDGSCSICGDEGRVAEVLEAGGGAGRGRVRLEEGPESGEERRVALDLVPRAEPGDRVVVHMGFAIGLLRDREEG